MSRLPQQVDMGETTEEDNDLKYYRSQIKKNAEGRLRLDLNTAELDLFPPAVAQLTQIEELFVCNTSIASLPEEMKNLKHLRMLKLRVSDLKNFPNPICDLEYLQELDLSINSITELPEDLNKLKQLKRLNLESNSLKDAEIKHLGKLANLEVLKLASNSLSSVPDSIGELKQLRELSLKHNDLTVAPGFLERLHSVKELDISYNRLKSFVLNLSKLTHLRNLDLEGNMLEEFPETVCALTSIERLDIAKNRIKTIPPSIVNLRRLKELWLEKNQLDQFPKVVCELDSLETVDLSGNNFRNVNDDISKLQNLRFLDLGNCGLQEFPESICSLQQLRWLCLNENSLTNLPTELTSLRNLLFIYLNGNPMERPPHPVCQRGVQAVFNYLKDAQKRRGLHQKVIFTGSVAAGKTSLARSLTKRCPILVDERERTIVLDRLASWTPEPDLNIQLYDFGGHKWYEMVHHFFLDKSAIILLIVNLATYQMSEYEKHVGSWLSVMQARAPGATVKLVGTNIDRCSTGEAKNKAEEIVKEMTVKENLEVEGLKEAIERQGSNLGESQSSRLRASLATRLVLPKKMHVVSSKTFENCDELRIELLSAARQQGKVIPASWQGLLDTVNRSVSSDNDKKFLTLTDVLEMHGKSQSEDDFTRTYRVFSRSKTVSGGADPSTTREREEPQLSESSTSSLVTSLTTAKREERCINSQRFQNSSKSHRPMDTSSSTEERGNRPRSNTAPCELQLAANFPLKQQLTRKLSNTPVCYPETPLAGVLSFFHSIGELLWFEHNHAISEFVFHQQEHLICLLKSIFSEHIEQKITDSDIAFLKQKFTKVSLNQAKQDLLERGIMSRPLLRGLWDQMNLAPEMFTAMTELLTQFDLCYPMTVGSEVTSWRFPWFLKEDPPFEDNLFQEQHLHRFTLEFEFLLRSPSTMYEKISIRLHKCVTDINSIRHWRCGMMAHVQNSRFVIQRSVERKTISLSVMGTYTDELWKLLLRLVRDAREVMAEWPGVSYEMWFVCPQCMQKGTMEAAHRFSGDCIEGQCPKDEVYMTCPKENASVPVHLLFPKEGMYVFFSLSFSNYFTSFLS